MTRTLQKSARTAAPQSTKRDVPNGRRVKFKTDERFRWLDEMMATPKLKAVAYRIAYYFAHDCAGPNSLGIFPTQETIAARLKVSLTAAKDALRQMEMIGFIRRNTRGLESDRKATSYVLMWPANGRESAASYSRKSDGDTVGNPPIEPPLNEPTPLPEGRGGIGSTESIGSRNISAEENSDPHWHLRRDTSHYLPMDDERRARDAPGSLPTDESIPICAEGDDYDDCPF